MATITIHLPSPEHSVHEIIKANWTVKYWIRDTCDQQTRDGLTSLLERLGDELDYACDIEHVREVNRRRQQRQMRKDNQS